jgi:translocation and assembly module TamB
LSLQLNEDYLAVSDSFLAAGDTDMSVQVDAEVDLAASVVTGDLRWENATWPIAAGVPAVSSKSGDITVDGSPDDWRIDGRVEVGTAAIPSGQFRIDGRGDRHHVEATIVESEVLGGVVSGRVAFNWRDQQEWSAELDTSNVDIGSFVDGWPGHISGRIDASGAMSPFALDLLLSNIDGALRGGPLSTNGGLSLADNRVRATDLKILHGDTRVALDGDLLARSGLTFDVSVDDVSLYLGEADGAFAAAGSISLHPDLPSLDVNATSAALGFGDIRVTGIEVDATAQSLQFDATHSDTDIHLLVAGEFDDLKNPNSWRGELQELSLAMAGEFAAEMSAPTTLSLSRKTITIDRGCLAATDGMHLCAQAEWSADNYLHVGADLADVPLDLVNSFIDTKFEFDQHLNGNFEWQRNEISGTKGNAEMTMTAGRFVSIDNPDVTIDTDTGLLTFDIVNGQLLSGHTTLPLPGLGHIEAQFAVADVTLGKDSGISGLFDIDLSDMALLAAISPLIDKAGGELEADLTLSGSLSVPQLTGDLAITNGSVSYLPIGLRLDQINITGRLQDDGQIEFGGDFRAGDGRGEIITRSDYQTRISNGFEVELRGNNMTVIDVPDVQARADVDLRVGYDYETLTLDGRVFIPHTLIKPSNLTLARDTESEDVVVVAGELPDDPRQSREQPVQMAGSLEVEFGDDVLIDLGRATAKLTGSTVFSWEDSQVPIADGRYDLTGDVRAFGQVLGITEGGLRFPKIPADNPFIRIRAEREIYGNPQVKTAGVLVDGTLKKPTIEAYTNPHTTEERALALLVTGSDFNYEQGVGAIDFGTYIAPRIFVSYGVGLFETENVIRVRYDIKRGFGITATSGQKETGVDLSYRIER